MKNLPIGIQSFSKIRDKERNYYYVDKTKFAYNLVNSYNVAFLSRPRRFGKSLFVDTLKELFEGNKELFEGLFIYDKWNWNEKYPVIHISFFSAKQDKQSLINEEINSIKKNYEKFGLVYNQETTPEINFNNLIEEVSLKSNKKVVILIDEYDKPILERIDNDEERQWAMSELKSLYTSIKDKDQYIQFAFLTGVTKFSQVSIFSGLNNLVDISLKCEFGDVCGYTNNDINTVFKERLDNIDMNKLKEYYDGYDFEGSKLYAPQDILQFFDNDFKYKNYWFNSGTPSYLLKLLETNNFNIKNFDSGNIKKTDDQLTSPYDVDNLDLPILLYQSGYLTISEEQEIGSSTYYKLDFPNISVRSSFYNILCKFIFEGDVTNSNITLYQALELADFDLMEKTIRTLFASIPHQYNPVMGDSNRISDYEGFYSSILFAHLKAVNVFIDGESSTNKGRLDLYIRTSKHQYVFEFKIGKSDALAQILDRKYYEKYLGDTTRDLYLVGINFDINDKNISKIGYMKL